MSEQPLGSQPTQPTDPGAASYPPPVPQAPPTVARQWGPPGKPRGIGVSILLAIVTIGIYTYVWTWKTHDEIKQHSGQGVGGALGFVIYFVVSPVTFFLLANEVEKMLQQAGQPSRVRTITGLWVLLPLLGSIIWFVKVQGQLNDYWRSIGAHG